MHSGKKVDLTLMANEFAADAGLLRSAAEEAAALALSYWGKSVKIEGKSDGSPVTEADLAVDALLAKILRGARPDYGWLSEESAEHAGREACERVWVVDPIDGTRAFIKGQNDWTIALALVENGEAVVSVVINPVRGQLFEATRGGGAFLNGAPMAPSPQEELCGARVVASDGILRKKIWPEPWPEMNTLWVNSLAYRLALVACGEIDAAFALQPKSEWDVVAGILLVNEAGGRASLPNGKDFKFNSLAAKVEGFLATAPKLHQILIKRLEGVVDSAIQS